jgi:hypothetical protein
LATLFCCFILIFSAGILVKIGSMWLILKQPHWSIIMSQLDKASLIQPLVEQMVTNEKDVSIWRKELVSVGAFSTEQVMALDDASLTLAYRTMLAVQFQGFRVERLLTEIEKHHVAWTVDLNDDFQQGAICY